MSPELPLKRVAEIKYLGVKVTRNLEDYVSLNVEPLFAILKSKTQTWSRLGVMGRINLIKMILLPKMLYAVWHAPMYIPLKVFKQMEAILNSFVWGKGRHKLAWHVLKNPALEGGCSLPDIQDYYVASQLSHLYYFHTTASQRYRTLVCDKPGSPLHTSIQTILQKGHCGHKSPRYNTGMLTHHQKIWDIELKKQNRTHIHSYTSLWYNSRLPELCTKPDPKLWAAYGILIYLSQVLMETGPKNFQTLKEEFSLPNHLLFQYLQLRHAVRAQSADIAIALDTPPVLNVILGADPTLG